MAQGGSNDEAYVNAGYSMYNRWEVIFVQTILVILMMIILFNGNMVSAAGSKT